MQQSMRLTIRLVRIMLHVRDVKRKLEKKKMNTLVENANNHLRLTYPQYCIHFANALLFLKSSSQLSLKEGQTYAVTRTYIPKNIIHHDSHLKKIKKVTIFMFYLHFCFCTKY